MSAQVKICGLTTKEAVEAAQDADFIGFIFYPPSPRNIIPAKAAELGAASGPAIVAVTVDADNKFLNEIVSILKPAYLQLHGNESPARVRELKEMFVGGKIHPHVSAVYPLAETPRALRSMLDRTATGKVLIDPNQ